MGLLHPRWSGRRQPSVVVARLRADLSPVLWIFCEAVVVVGAAGMGRLTFGRLSEAWRGEASDFTPLLAEQLDALGDAIGVPLAPAGQVEVPSTGGRRIDIMASGADGEAFVIENQYGRADHDHLTRGLAYAVAGRARGLVVVAEEHRDEFRAVAQYLNELAEQDVERGILVWLVEARAVRVGNSQWAPLFTAVVEPNAFTARVEQAVRGGGNNETAYWSSIQDSGVRTAARTVLDRWVEAGHRRRFNPTYLALEANGPSQRGVRVVIVLYADGSVVVPFGSYAGQNTGIPVPGLTTDEFRDHANTLFDFTAGHQYARTQPGWLQPAKVNDILTFAHIVAREYADALEAEQPQESRDANHKPLSPTAI